MHKLFLLYFCKSFGFLMTIIFYYSICKKWMISFAAKISVFLNFSYFIPKKDLDGVLEIIFISISHALFCCLFTFFLPIKWPKFYFPLWGAPVLFLYGVLLGVACMGVSAICCHVLTLIAARFANTKHYDLKTWLTLGRGGWIKHHIQSIEILPIYAALLFLVLQVGSEEMVFRGIVLNYFMDFGPLTAIMTSCVLFIVMQAFLMQRWEAACFAMMGATIMGIIHSILYIHIPILWPLIIAHVTFFLFSIL